MENTIIVFVSTVTKGKNRKHDVGRVKEQTSRRHLQEKKRVAWSPDGRPATRPGKPSGAPSGSRVE